MSDLIDRQALREAMYHEAFETDTPMQKWDSGCWIRYKMFERVLDSIPSVQPSQKNDSNTLDALDCVSRKAVVDDMKNMYQAAEKWGREAADDVIKARAESCMATLVEMKLRIEKLPSAQPDKNMIHLQKEQAYMQGWEDGREALRKELLDER